MKEALLQLIWQYQLLNTKHLTTIDGQPIEIIKVGMPNHHQGADFLYARIRIANKEWIGNIEIDLQTSFWEKHQHHINSDFKNIILHIVWQHDKEINHHIPILELQHKVSKSVIERYQQFIQPLQQSLACNAFVAQVPTHIVDTWKAGLLVERLVQKSTQFLKNVKQLNNDWETAFWWLLCSYFGMTINKETFLLIAQSIPIKVWMKERLSLTHIEALLFGQAGLLEKQHESDDYLTTLKNQYAHLQVKHHLKPIDIKVKFLRTRPANFPTIRLAQLASLVFHSSQLFNFVLQNNSPKTLLQWLQSSPSEYWKNHYLLGNPIATEAKSKTLGTDFANRLIINVIYPALFAYAHEHHNEVLQELIVEQMDALQKEKNHITQIFEPFGIANKNATDSQALIQLYNHYCKEKKCLTCNIGKYILTH